MTNRLDFTATWDDARNLLRVHGEGVGAIAGFLLFLPDWVANMLVRSEQLPADAAISDIVANWQEMAAANWYILIPAMLCSLLGTIALYVLLTRKDLPRIGDALRVAVTLIPVYLLAQILSGLAMGLGLIMLILPGLYLMGRLAPLGAVIAGEKPTVSEALARSWQLTHGHGWMIFLLMLMVLLVAFVLIMVATLAIKIPLALVAGPEGVPIVSHALNAFTNMIFSVISIALTVAIYRQLTVGTGE